MLRDAVSVHELGNVTRNLPALSAGCGIRSGLEFLIEVCSCCCGVLLYVLDWFGADSCRVSAKRGLGRNMFGTVTCSKQILATFAGRKAWGVVISRGLQGLQGLQGFFREKGRGAPRDFFLFSLGRGEKNSPTHPWDFAPRRGAQTLQGVQLSQTPTPPTARPHGGLVLGPARARARG